MPSGSSCHPSRSRADCSSRQRAPA
jgi:hypothetical protein